MFRDYEAYGLRALRSGGLLNVHLVFFHPDILEVSSCFMIAVGELERNNIYCPAQLDNHEGAPRRNILYTFYFTRNICLLWRLVPVC